MKLRLSIIVLVILCICALVLPGCQSDVVGASTVSASGYELGKYDSDYKKIIESGTKEFLGTHPLDESFLTWFISEYGEEDLNKIASRSIFDNPEVWYEVTGKSIHVLWYEYCLYTGLDAYETSYTHQVNTLSDDEIVFDIAGDVSLAEDKATTNYMLDQKNGLMDCFDDSLFDEINSSDIFIVNNEFAYTEGGDPIVEKYYTFRGKPNLIDELKHVGVGLVTIANNHIFDYREEGLLDTFHSLEQYKMPYIGAGRNLEDAKRPEYYIANGRKIAVVNASQIEKNQDFTQAASEDEMGILKCLDPADFIDEIQYAKSNSDYVVAIVHWGTEYIERYGSDQRQLAEAFADAGCDVIVGGHPHILQGFDYIGDTPIYYSLGNFFFSLDQNMPIPYDTGLARVSIGKEGKIEARFVPCHFDEGVISVVTGDDASRMFDELNRVSDNAMLNNNGVIIRK